MKKLLVFAFAALLALPVVANVIVDVTVPDPNNFVLTSSTLMSQYQVNGITAYNINTPANMNTLNLIVTTTGGPDTLIFSSYCSPSPNSPDSGAFGGYSPGKALWGFSSLAQAFTVPIPSQITSTASQPSSVTVSTAGCARLTIQIAYNAGALTDAVTIQGNFSANTINAGPGGPLMTLGMGEGPGGVMRVVFNTDTLGAGLIVDTVGGTPGDQNSVGGFERVDNGTFNAGLTATCGISGSANCTTDAAGDKFAVLDGLGAATTQMIALAAGQTIRIVSLIASNTSATATAFRLVTGTGANCGTGTAGLTSQISLIANQTVTQNFPKAGLRAPVSTAVCAQSSAAGITGVTLTYSQW